MHPVLAAQLADDFCCTVQEVCSPAPVFSVLEAREGQRRYSAKGDFFKAAVAGGKLIVAGSPEMAAWCRERYAAVNPAWFMEIGTLREIDARLAQDGLRIATAHPFFLPAHPVQPDAGGMEVRWYEETEIERFRGDTRFPQSYAFNAFAPDELGVSLSVGGEIVAMAGASRDSARMRQIGVDVRPDMRGRGLGSLVVSLLRNEIERRGYLPFYGTSMSHAASQRTALRAGFAPAWTELYAERIPE
ncbi:MAG: GNAT family N-acetyltransferase [Clostridia bacterium]|nr:GNAT family N-acetyltransferase [Clostridia bacterium]